MPAPGFPAFFEVFAESIAGMVAIVTTVCFAGRSIRNRAPLNLSGLVASVLTIFYTTCGLTYWFNGIEGFNCTILAAVNGTCMSASNASTFVHLFIKAHASNKLNPGWKYWQWVGICFTLLNWITLVTVHALLKGRRVDGIDGPRCLLEFEEVSCSLKWVAQWINQLFQALAFTLPFRQHLSNMDKISTFGVRRRPEDTIFHALVVRAVIAVSFSMAFTTLATGMSLAKQYMGKFLYLPMFPVAVLDNAINLGAIFFAVNVSKNTNQGLRQQHHRNVELSSGTPFCKDLNHPSAPTCKTETSRQRSRICEDLSPLHPRSARTKTASTLSSRDDSSTLTTLTVNSHVRFPQIRVSFSAGDYMSDESPCPWASVVGSSAVNQAPFFPDPAVGPHPAVPNVGPCCV